MKDKIILHVDMNNFFASVECLFHPEFKCLPMAVAGDPKKRHGIILAKNQLAKSVGVSTGEAIWQAKQKCPNLVLAPPHYDLYKKFSQEAINIYSRYTNQVESYGLDECWLDVTGSEMLFGNGVQIAKKIMDDIRTELGLTVSVGVSFNKIFAKLGSDMKKPDAMTEINKENFRKTVWNLPVSDLLFVGKSTNKSLQKYGIETIGALANTNKDLISQLLGKMGAQLWDYANGLDKSEVSDINQVHKLKSIGNSTTFPKDILDEKDIKKIIFTLSEQVGHRLRKRGLYASSLHLSVRRSNLEQYQKSVVLDYPIASSDAIFKEIFILYKSCKEKEAIRSLGIRAEKLSEQCIFQFSLFNENCEDKFMKLEKTKDVLRSKYGKDCIQRALLIENTNPSKDIINPIV